MHALELPVVAYSVDGLALQTYCQKLFEDRDVILDCRHVGIRQFILSALRGQVVSGF